MTATTYPYGSRPANTGNSPMTSLVGPLAGVAGNVLSGLLQDRGTRRQNRMNLQIAREQMAFQERMSSTAYQRSADDAEAAGLNRIIALGSPATTPSGAKAEMRNPQSGKSQAAREAAHSALTLKQQIEAIQVAKNQARNLLADTNLKGEQAIVAQGTDRNLRATNALIRQQTEESRARTNVSSAQAQIQGAYADFYNTIPNALIALKEFPVIGTAASALGRALLRGRDRRRPRTTETTRFNRDGTYQGGSVRTTTQ